MPSKSRVSKAPNLPRFREALSKIPATIATRAAKHGAIAITALARDAFDAGVTPYGKQRPEGGGKYVPAHFASVYRTGSLRAAMGFTSGHKGKLLFIRATLGVPYAKYMIGRFWLLPFGNMRIPRSWIDALNNATRQAFQEESRRVDSAVQSLNTRAA